MLRYESTTDAPVRPKRLRFTLLSTEEIRRISVCHVTETTLYYRGLPATGGLLDPLMGTVDRRHLCASCLGDARTCQGHPGHMDLAFPVYHIGFIETVLRVLRTTCFFCARVCYTADEVAALATATGTSRTRLTDVHAALRSRKVCPHCTAMRPTYTRLPLGIAIEWPADMTWESEEERAHCTLPFTAREALSILRHMTDDDVAVLGFDPNTSRPHNMIVETLVVPPPCTRPAVYSTEGSRSRGQNELTIRLLEVLKRSQELHASLEGTSWKDVELTEAVVDRLQRLQYEVFMLVNSNARVARPSRPGGRQGLSSAYKGLTQRLKGKEGRVRGNLMGKRVDFSARCVITPDAYFECDRVGVPYSIAKSLTVPETVNAMNVRSLIARVRRGSSTVHGANAILRRDGSVIDLTHCRDRQSLQLLPGDVVERFLADDDTVVFNRQPSLHMYGMQAHRVRLMPGHTFRLSLVVAAPYNADFDGDEMNLHVPQSKAASTECATLMSVAQNVLGAQSNRPTMGIVQDSLLGLHLLSQPGCVFDHGHTCRILGVLLHREEVGALPLPAVRLRRGAHERRWWTGAQLFSELLPSRLYVEPERVLGDLVRSPPASLPVVVRCGRLLCGVLRKAHVGTAAGGIVDILARECGSVACLHFMSDAQRLTHAFLLQFGHHVGIDDVLLSEEGHARVRERLDKVTRLCEEIQHEAHATSESVVREAEAAVQRLLSKTLLQTGGIVDEHMSDHNAIRRMVTAGSKGSFLNLSQISAALGQQSLEGARIAPEKDGRTLPCFRHGDTSLASRGMVYNSFALGLTPSELFFHGVGGREGLVDTAVKTSVTGYLQRRMNKSMEDHRVQPDGTVRTSDDDVVSFSYGTDGMHPTRVERVRCKLLLEPEHTVRARMTPEEATLALALRADVLRTRTHCTALQCDLRILLPFHPHRVLREVHRAASNERTCVPVDPSHASSVAIAFARRVPKATGLALLDVLCASSVATLSRSAHADLVRRLELLVEDACAPPGESVGCIAAQSVGEVVTQLTLNSFHTSGFAANKVSTGIPRLKELIDASRTPKTPCTTLRFLPSVGRHGAVARYVADTLPLTRLTDVVVRCDIVSLSTTSDDWMHHCDVLIDGPPPRDASQYVVCLELNQELMRTRRLTPPIVRSLVRERLHGRAIVSSTETNAVDWSVHLRFLELKEMVQTGNLHSEQELVLCHRAINVLLDTMVVSGHPEVTYAHAHVSTRAEWATSSSDPGPEEHVVEVQGRVLADLACMEGVDWTHCVPNDVWETLELLGVEACAHMLFDQLRAVIAFDGTYIDDRHLMLVVDTMLRRGTLMPLNRHGINRVDTSPLMRCSFEETIDVLCDAAIFSEAENARGCTSSIMLGQLGELGTGCVEVQFPTSKQTVTCQKRGRVLRSTCRSHDGPRVPQEALEYLMEDAVPRRVTSPPRATVSVVSRSRVRFRPRSPPL